MAARRRERWYSMDGQRRSQRMALESNKGMRQLVSLVVLLALVLIAMRQVSDPQRVGRVASAVGLLPVQPTDANDFAVNNGPQRAATPNQIAGGGTAYEEKVTRTLVSSDPEIESQALILHRLLDAASASVLSNLAFEYLIAPESQLPAIELSDKDVKERAEWLESSKKQILRWTELSESVSREHAQLSNLWKLLDRLSEPFNTEDWETGVSNQAFRLALDRALLSQFSDNTPWRSSDRIPLMRLTQRAVDIGGAIAQGKLVPEILPAISIPQVMGDTDSLRGRAVRISGRIALVDQPASMTVADPRINEYGVLWLRPDDGSNQPIIVHVPKSLGIPAETWKKDQAVLVSGLVAKRRAYASNRGGDIAPVMVACYLQDVEATGGVISAKLTEEQRRSAAIWQQPLPAKRWKPPADISGALERIEKRIGARIGPLETRISEISFDDPEALDALARNEGLQATLDGLLRVVEEVELVSDPLGRGRSPRDSRIRGCRGMVTQVRRIPIEKEPFPGWQWKELYVCTLEPYHGDQTSSPCTIITQRVPSSWLIASELRQPVVAMGLAFDAPDPEARTLMISPAVEWRHGEIPGAATPSTAAGSTVPALPEGWSTLLTRGWNLEWIDMLEGLQGRPMTARESKAFYHLLRCSQPPVGVQEVDGGKGAGDQQVLSVMQAIQRAEARKTKRDAPAHEFASVGYRIAGIAEVRRVQRVDVRDPIEQEWLGADHYYQLDGFADIGNSRITIRYEESEEPIVFDKEFPVTLVALKVPSDLLVDAGDAITGESQAWYPRTRIWVSGWFYRMWRFKTAQVSQATNDKQAQQGPLLIIDRFDAAPAREVVGASNASPQMISFVTVSIGILGALWIGYQVLQGLRRGRRPKR